MCIYFIYKDNQQVMNNDLNVCNFCQKMTEIRYLIHENDKRVWYMINHGCFMIYEIQFSFFFM